MLRCAKRQPRVPRSATIGKGLTCPFQRCNNRYFTNHSGLTKHCRVIHYNENIEAAYRAAAELKATIEAKARSAKEVERLSEEGSDTGSVGTVAGEEPLGDLSMLSAPAEDELVQELSMLSIHFDEAQDQDVSLSHDDEWMLPDSLLHDTFNLAVHRNDDPPDGALSARRLRNNDEKMLEQGNSKYRREYHESMCGASVFQHSNDR